MESRVLSICMALRPSELYVEIIFHQTVPDYLEGGTFEVRTIPTKSYGKRVTLQQIEMELQ